MTELILPPGYDDERGLVEIGPPMDLPQGQGMVVNESDLPDEVVQSAVETYFEEHASVLGIAGSNSFQTYAQGQGSLLARSKFRVPTNVMDEIALARNLADMDDDVAATLGAMSAMAFGEGMQHVHPDEVTVALFDEIAKETNMDSVLAESYRELLISSQINTLTVFVRDDLQVQPQGADRQRTRSVVVPQIGVLPAERIRVIGSDLLHNAVLAYKPPNGTQEAWLNEYFSPGTTPARRAEMQRQDPVLTTMLVRRIQAPIEERTDMGNMIDPCVGEFLFVVNPRMVHRSTFPKGANKYPRPLMTRNFALLEAKRLLNLMDYALLQGGSNFLVVAKKGSDQRPAVPAEIANLRDTIKRASRTGVVIGDHRLNIEIITPKLDELLSPKKRGLLARKIASALLRIPEVMEPGDGGSEVAKTNAEILTRVITQDRRIIKRHIENNPYSETAKRNTASFATGPASIWFPKIILAGSNFFTDYVLKLRDRGDISRHTAVQVAGFDYDAEVAARKLEKPDDKLMTPAEVPFSSPGQPADNGGGRPTGGSAANGQPGSQPGRSTRDPARGSRVVTRNAGETVRAFVEEEFGVVRVGEQTYALLEEYADTKEIGRITALERRALERIAAEEWPEEVFQEGPLTVVPVNPGHEIDDVKAVRLAPGLTALVGNRSDGAVLTRALSFREPEFSAADAEERALRWGFPTRLPEEEHAAGPAPASSGTREDVTIIINTPEAKPVKRKLIRDEETGAIIGSEEVALAD